MKIFMYVDGKQALREGKDLFGCQFVEIPAKSIPEDLREFLEVECDQRQWMRPVRMINGKSVTYPPIGEASTETLFELLEYAQEFKADLLGDAAAAATAEKEP